MNTSLTLGITTTTSRGAKSVTMNAEQPSIRWLSETVRIAKRDAWDELHRRVCIPGFLPCVIHRNPYDVPKPEGDSNAETD